MQWRILSARPTPFVLPRDGYRRLRQTVGGSETRILLSFSRTCFLPHHGAQRPGATGRAASVERLSKQAALAKLDPALRELDNVKAGEPYAPRFESWRRETEAALRYVFGDRSDFLADFKGISYHGPSLAPTVDNRLFGHVRRPTSAYQAMLDF